MSTSTVPVATEVLTKRTLITVSHAIERAALAYSGDSPMAVVALFQRLPYFHRERAVYTELGARSAATVVGFVEDFRTTAPVGVSAVRLLPEEDLSREWAVTLLTPSAGAVLVATDREEVAPGEGTLEGGRLFDGRWSFRRDEAYAEMVRLRSRLADRLPAATIAGLDRVLESAAERPAGPAEPRIEASLRLLTTELDRVRRRGQVLQDAADAATDREVGSGLYTERYLRRWTGLAATTASGTLPLGLVLVGLPEMRDAVARHGLRSGTLALRSVVDVLTRRLGPADRAVRLDADEFLLVVPSADYDGTVALSHAVSADLADLGRRFPFVPVTPTAALTVTRDRPLPLAELRDAVAWARQEGVGLAAVG